MGRRKEGGKHQANLASALSFPPRSPIHLCVSAPGGERETEGVVWQQTFCVGQKRRLFFLSTETACPLDVGGKRLALGLQGCLLRRVPWKRRRRAPVSPNIRGLGTPILTLLLRLLPTIRGTNPREAESDASFATFLTL